MGAQVITSLVKNEPKEGMCVWGVQLFKSLVSQNNHRIWTAYESLMRLKSIFLHISCFICVFKPQYD